MKKISLVLLTTSCLLLAVSPFSVRAELLIGRIVDIAPDRPRLTLKTIKEGREVEQLVTVTMADDFRPRGRHQPEDRFFPGCVRIGSAVRVWGEFTSRHDFLATDLRGPGPANDPSGVRGRIGRGCCRPPSSENSKKSANSPIKTIPQ